MTISGSASNQLNQNSSRWDPDISIFLSILGDSDLHWDWEPLIYRNEWIEHPSGNFTLILFLPVELLRWGWIWGYTPCQEPRV